MGHGVKLDDADAKGGVAHILLELVRQDQKTELIMMDATCLKAQRTASSLRKKGVAGG
jgi:hypothetical protein